MKNKAPLRDSLISFLVLAAAFGISVLLQNFLSVDEHITTVFVFGVFLISLLTEGYVYGLLSSAVAVFAVNFAFTFPYFAFDFEIPENLLSAIVMSVISLITSGLISRLKRWQQIKAQSDLERMRANLLRAVSHDLRTPLTTIYGSASLLTDSYRELSDGEKLRIVGGIKEDSGWLVGIVENLLSVTRIDGTGVDLIKTPTVLWELVDSVIRKIRKRYPDAPLKLNLPDDTVVIPMDPMLIEQVLVNIIENALYHAVGMSFVMLSVSVSDGMAHFEISDDGCGIPEARIATVFDGYNGASDASPDNKKRNAGIGLSVCSAIINAHGGRVTAENGKDGGAIFRFSLELCEEVGDGE